MKSLFTTIFNLRSKTKLTLLFCCILFLKLNASTFYSANTRISLDFTQVPLLEVLEEIEQKTAFTFFYKNEDIDFDRKITIKTKQSTVESILFLLFENENISYEILHEKIIIKKQKQLHINGKIIDKITGDAISYCNITSLSSTTGTASNELGEFVISVDSLPAILVFSHIIYGQQIREISKISEIVIELEPLANVLEEVTIVATKKDKYAIDLAKNALRKAEKAAKKDNYGKALYRQKTKNGKLYAEFSEIIYDIRYTSKGIEDWEILEGRYALNESMVHNKNYTLLSRLLKPLQPNTKDLVFPLHPEMETYYDLRVISHLTSEDQKIAVVWFKPKEKPVTPTFEGEVYIDVNTYDILKINGSIAQDDLKLIKIQEKNSYWKNYELSYEIGYKLDSTFSSVIDYIKVDQGFDYYKEDNFLFRTNSTSNLTFFEYYTPLARKKLGGKFKKNRSDWQLLNEIGYNEKFWEENPIVKRTPIEEEVISSFEKDEAFGSIFLNSRDQVALIQSNISEDPFIKDLGASVNNYNNYNPVEKVYLHTDKDLFAVGENIWYSAYVVLGSYLHYSLASKVLYVDLIGPNNKIITSQTKELINGKNAGAIRLPQNLPSGDYQLRSYTQWMRNSDPDFFFTKSLKILNPTINSSNPTISGAAIDLQFFPEGGQAVAGLNGVIAFKAIGEDGLATDIKGKIVDSQGNFISSLNTIIKGSGFFNLLPKTGEQYTVVLADGSTYPLPKVMDYGYGITVNNVNSKSIRITVQTTSSLRDKTFYVVGHSQNKKHYQGKFEFGKDPSVSFEIPKSKIPSGIMTLTLFDADKKPWCERLVFINNQEELVITTKLDLKKFKKRAKIDLNIHVADTDGRPVSTALSVAVTDAGQVLKSSNSENILTHLLLQSDIQGTITEPGALFKNKKKVTLRKLDLIMLTHGWRKLNWEKVWNSNTTSNEYPFSKGLTISGIASNLSNQPLANTSINIFGKSKKNASIYTTQTDNKGRFSIDNFNLADSVQVIFKAYSNKKRPLNLKIALDENPIKPPHPSFKKPSFFSNKETQTYITNIDFQENLDASFEVEGSTVLDEVVLAADKIIKKENATPSVYGITPDATLYPKDYNSIDLLTLISRFPGVRVSPNSVSIRNNTGNPLWILDGIPITTTGPGPAPVSGASEISDIGAITSGGIPSAIQSLNIFSIERVELLKGPAAAIYGIRGGNGVILIYTKIADGQAENVLSPSFNIQGHAVTKEFYVPKYDVKTDISKTQDNRSTLYWNPHINTDVNGNAQIQFFNSYTAEQIQIQIEGLSIYGIPGAYMNTYGNTEQSGF